MDFFDTLADLRRANSGDAPRPVGDGGASIRVSQFLVTVLQPPPAAREPVLVRSDSDDDNDDDAFLCDANDVCIAA